MRKVIDVKMLKLKLKYDKNVRNSDKNEKNNW